LEKHTKIKSLIALLKISDLYKIIYLFIYLFVKMKFLWVISLLWIRSR